MKKPLDNWTRQRLASLKEQKEFLLKIHCEKAAEQRQREIDKINNTYQTK